MHIVITGAGGFIGRHLARHYLDNDLPDRLTLVDLHLHESPYGKGVNPITGSFTDPDVLDRVFSEPVDLLYHLASIPSGLAEQEFQLGVDVNIHGTMTLLEKLRQQGNRPAVVFASSIAVYGKPSAAQVDEQTLPAPNLSYGAEKIIGETLVADYCRREWLRGCSVRIPGIVARPPEPNGAVSIFFSDLIRNLSQGKPFICPVSEAARSWLMSVPCCVRNLLNAATREQGRHATWTLPALHVRIGDLVAQIDALNPELDVSRLISYDPNPWVEENFGSYPPLDCPGAEAAGFSHDGDLENLVRNALAGFAH